MNRPVPTLAIAYFCLSGLSALFVPGPAAAQRADVGLSAVRAQQFFEEDFLGFNPHTGDLFGFALATGDFDGDGVVDLATAIPGSYGDPGNPVEGCGAVLIRYGAPGVGLLSFGRVVGQFVPGSPDPAEPFDQFGFALASCDFNGDGFDDLAVGVSGQIVNSGNGAGAVEIYYGASGGLAMVGTVFTENTPGIPSVALAGDGFGRALACGDFIQDGRDDLVVGAPGEDFAIGADAGLIVVIPGALAGLDPAHAIALHQDTPGMLDAAEPDDQFGKALAVGDFDGDGFDDLAVGVPTESIGAALEAGAVQIVHGSAAGLTAIGNQFFTEGSFGGLSESGDNFGYALAAGDFDGDGFADLAIGAPTESLGNVLETGNVDEVFGSATGLGPARSQGWDQDRILGSGNDQESDLFGAALAAGDFDHDGFDDLAIGHHGEAVGTAGDGAATIVMGSAGFGLNPAADRRRMVIAGHDGFPGHAESRLGQALAVGDFDGDSHADLVIGAPYASYSALTSVGEELVLYGALFADGVESAASQWTAALP